MSTIILRCALDKVTLGAVLQMLLSERVDVRVRIKGAESSGWLDLHAGDIWDAACADLIGRDAAIELLLNERGSLEAHLSHEVPSRQIKSPSLALQMEAFRQKDHWANQATMTLSGPSTKGFQSIFERFLLDGMPIAQAAAFAGLPRTMALRTVEKLMSEDGWKRGGRVLKRKAPQPSVLKKTAAKRIHDLKPTARLPEVNEVAEKKPSDELLYYAAMDRGMDARKKGNFVEARVAWEEALSLRPDDRMATFNLRRLERLAKPISGGGL